MKPTLTGERASQLLEYDAVAGNLRWKHTRGSVKAGDVAGTRHCNGYLQICIDRRSYLAHRLAWLMTYGRWPHDQIDHRDGDRTNNRITNLRECICRENRQNVHVALSRNKSGLLGVLCDHRYFSARITVNGHMHHLGMFAAAADAHAAYLSAKRRLHPFAATEHIR